jgi:hypothetical protein
MLFRGSVGGWLRSGNAPRWRGCLQLILASAASTVYIGTIAACDLLPATGRMPAGTGVVVEADVACQFGEGRVSTARELTLGDGERNDKGAGETASRPKSLAFEFGSVWVGPS